MLAMSTFDMIYSATAVLQMYLLPRETSPRVTAIGTPATCTALGALLQLSYTTFWYNGLLSLYYVTTIVYGWTEKSLSVIEPFLNGFCICVGVGTAAYGSLLGWFSETDIGFGCWVHDYPRGCEQIDEFGDMGEECLSPTIAWYIAGYPLGFLLTVVVACNLRIYFHVRHLTTTEVSNTDNEERCPTPQTVEENVAAVVETSGEQPEQPRCDKAEQQQQEQQEEEQAQYRSQVATQCFSYEFCFWCTSIFTVAIRIIETYGGEGFRESDIYGLLLLHAIVTPSTGVCNMMIFFRPRYLKIRREFPDESRWWAFQRACFGTAFTKRSSSADRGFLYRLFQCLVCGKDPDDRSSKSDDKIGIDIIIVEESSNSSTCSSTRRTGA